MDTIRCIIGLMFLYTWGPLSTSSSSYCGERHLTAIVNPRVLKSPGFPYKYLNNLNCTWTITTTSRNIKIVVTNSEVGCEDKVIVYDGAPNRKLGTFCGYTLPTYISSFSTVIISFISDNRFQSAGFRMKYTGGYFNEQCEGVHLTASSSVMYLTSPGYPSKYTNNLDCKWTISTNGRFQNLNVILTDADIEISSNCNKDSVKVYDGPISNANLLGQFCSYQHLGFVSSERSMVITFTTNGRYEGKGFKLSYQAGYFTVPERKYCHGNLTADTYPYGYITSPGYPHHYASNLECKWIITANHTSNIKIVVTDADMESSTKCDFDSVKVYDGPSTSRNLLGIFCGTQKPSFVSTTFSMTVTFTTDTWTSGKGFKLSYRFGHFSRKETEPNCVSTSLTALSYSQYLTSLGYPLTYSNNLDCKWIITATRSSYNIKLIVTDADIELTSDCNHDSVKVFDGPNEYSSVLGTFCGELKPSYVSSGNTVTVTFKTDGTFVARGFRMSYQHGHFSDGSSCARKELIAHEWASEITSPLYPSDYPNNTHCAWTIDSGNSNHVVYIEIMDLDIQHGIFCQYDYLQAFDGLYHHDPSLGKWCGSKIPSAQLSTGQYMYIKFHSDDNIRRTGFKLQYSSTLTSKFSMSGAIIGGVVVGSTIIISIACFLYCRAKMKRRTQMTWQNNSNNASTPRPQHLMVHLTRSNRITMRIPAATFVPPPSYDEVMACDQLHQSEAPPPYSGLSAISEEVTS